MKKKLCLICSCLIAGLIVNTGISAQKRTNTPFEVLTGPEYPITLGEQMKSLQQDEQLQRFKESRKELGTNPYRPLYHFSPPEKGLNDPNGLCYWQGKYHLFYQFTPSGFDRVHWGHTISEDMVHWEDLPVAIYPTTEQHCFSGQILVEQDRVVAMYHGTKSGNSIATSSDPLLLNWEKHPGNPVIPNPPPGTSYKVFDPCIWKEEDGYYALSGTHSHTAKAIWRNVNHLFRSRDLSSWEYLGPLIEGGFWTDPGEDGAVPNFLPISKDKYMLLFFSHKRAAQYYIGTYDQQEHKLIPEIHGRMNYGPPLMGSLHAPSATIDDKGRFICIFNVKPLRRPMLSPDCLMSLPRHLFLNEDGSLGIEPLEEIKSLRYGHKEVPSQVIPVNQEVILDEVGGNAIEIQAIIQPGEAREVGLNVLRSPGGKEQTTITLYMNAGRDPLMRELSIDISRASLHTDILSRSPETGPLKLSKGEALEFRIFIDKSIVEVFTNGRQCLTLRTYPSRQDSQGISVFARGGDAKLLTMNVWQMKSIWPEF